MRVVHSFPKRDFYPKSNNSYFQKGVIMADKKFDKINSVEALEAKLVEIRAAEEIWATFPQEKVDAICEAAAMAADKMRIPLAKMAHEETKAGIVVDKITKNNYAA